MKKENIYLKLIIIDLFFSDLYLFISIFFFFNINIFLVLYLKLRIVGKSLELKINLIKSIFLINSK